MTAVSQKIPYLIGGVSQQPDSLKLPGQVRECINFYPDPTFGLSKRPGLRFIQRLSNAPSDGSWFFVNKGEQDQLLVSVEKNGTVRLWDALSGIPQTLNTPLASATSYAAHTDRRDLEVLQINDYIFVLNRKISVAANTAVQYTQTPFGFVTLNTVGYNTTYLIKLNTLEYKYTTPGSVNGAILNGIRTNGGSAYTNGTYADVPLTGGTGSGARASITVSGGAVTSVQIIDKGNSYKTNDILSANASDIGGTGSGFTYKVTQIGNDNPELASTDVINGLTTQINLGGIYTATPVGNSIHIKRVNNNDFSLSCSGGLTGAGIEGFKGSVDTVSQLPRQFVNDAVIRVRAAADSTGDDYFVRFKTTNASATGAGIWEEVVAPNTPRGLNPDTMPHAIIKEANGTYTFRSLSESAAGAYNLTTSVSGIPTAVSLVSAGTSRWSIGQSFPVYEGTGINLRLRVTSTNQDGFITGVEIIRNGQGYTALDTVTSATGDTFTITSVATQTVSGETWAKSFWKDRQAGDTESNPDPSFVGFPITGIAFFKNRLVMLSRESVIASQAGKYFDFYASSVITIVDSDPIDLSAGSLKPIDLKYAIPTARSLVVFSENAQYILETTTEAFSASTAELNLLSSYSQTVDVAPVDTGSTVVILDNNSRATLAWELLIGEGSSNRPQVAEITRVIPSYIPSGVFELKASPAAGTIAMLTKEERDTIYFFRYYNNGSERVMASWFKWVMPGTVEMIDFDGDTLHCLLRGDEGVVLTSALLLTETPGGAFLFEDKIIDVRLDLYDYNPAKSYNPTTDTTKIFLKYGAKMPRTQAVLINIAPDTGLVQYLDIQYDPPSPVGQRYFITVPGNQSASTFAIGYQIQSQADLPAFFVKQDRSTDTLNIPTVHRISLDSYNSGPFRVRVEALGREPYFPHLPQIFANQYQAGSIPMVRNAINVVPILAKGNQVDVSLRAPHPFPVNLTSLTWEGTYNNKGIRSL